ncbi:MAG: hypothetical protein K0R01_4114, partial [Mycobacterium sp.]|nr:hypothetical protein [Mycobacterium sp.]
TDQNTWTALGTTTSPLAPTRSETEPTELTLGDSTFYWQTTPGATDYRYFRLTLPDGTTSDTLDTTTLEAPQPTALTSVELVGKAVAGSPLENNAVLRPNGLDQASLQVTLRDQDSRLELDPEQSPELYGRLYYRDSVTQALLTGLSGVDGSQKTTTFTTTPGQFAENQGAGPAPTYAPVHVATGESNLSFQAHFKANAKNAVTHFNSQPVIVRPVTGLLDVKGTAGNGMVVDGCPEGACVLTPPAPNRPVLHGLTGKTVSLQLKSSAIPGTLSLPLVSETEYPEKITLAQSALNYGSNSKVTLDNASSFVTHWPTITTSFVAEGQLVRAENVYIKAKG